MSTVCSLCVHLYVTDDSGPSPNHCPRCQEPPRVVCRETLAQLRQTQGGRPAPSTPAARGRFRAILRTRPGAPWISPTAMETLSTALVHAVDRAARGHRDAGYAGLIRGLRAAEAGAADGTLWGAALIRCYREVLDLYAGRYDIGREAEGPRQEPPLLTGPSLLTEPALAIMEVREEGPVPAPIP